MPERAVSTGADWRVEFFENILTGFIARFPLECLNHTHPVVGHALKTAIGNAAVKIAVYVGLTIAEFEGGALNFSDQETFSNAAAIIFGPNGIAGLMEGKQGVAVYDAVRRCFDDIHFDVVKIEFRHG